MNDDTFYKIRLDLVHNTINNFVHVMQYDDGVAYIRAEIYKNWQLVHPNSEFDAAQLRIKKPNGGWIKCSTGDPYIQTKKPTYQVAVGSGSYYYLSEGSTYIQITSSMTEQAYSELDERDIYKNIGDVISLENDYVKINIVSELTDAYGGCPAVIDFYSSEGHIQTARFVLDVDINPIQQGETVTSVPVDVEYEIARLKNTKSSATNLENGEGENSVQQKIDDAEGDFYMPGSARPEISHVPTELDRVEGTDEPYETGAFGKNSAMLGRRGRVEARGSASVGNRNLIKKQNGFASGNANIINADNAMVGGSLNRVDGPTSMSVGYNNYVEGEQSFSTGMGNKESSNRSVMAGKANDNEGSESFVAGTGNTNKGTGSVISGYGNENEASDSIVDGMNNSNTGNKSIVSGTGNTNSGEDSVVSGSDNTNSAQKTIVVGRDSTSTGQANAVFGYDSHAYGTGDFVAGWSTVTGNYSGAVGYGIKVSHNNSFAIGKYNVDNPLLVFAVGVGTSDANRLDAFEVYADGHAEVKTQGTADKSVAQVKFVQDYVAEHGGGSATVFHFLGEGD